MERGLEVVIPNEDDMSFINHVIFDELCLGKINEDSQKEFCRIISDLKKNGAEAVILGCTEIGLLVKQEMSVLPVFDTTVIHATKAAEIALEA